jgi:hypothetical protein
MHALISPTYRNPADDQAPDCYQKRGNPPIDYNYGDENFTVPKAQIE